MSSPFTSPKLIFSSAALLRVILLFYGLYQDANSPMKYTDIDYVVFTDAARFVSQGRSPYDRDTYRYTPLLAWILVPTSWGGPAWMLFGKALFAIADIVAGWLIVLLLKEKLGTVRALKYASIWLLNPMVATISTRGSSEGLLGVMSVALLWAVERRKVVLAGVLLGVGVHFKIYPFIFGPSIIWWMDEDQKRAELARRDGGSSSTTFKSLARFLRTAINPSSITLTFTALSVFTVLNYAMYALYGAPFLQHTYFHHLTRIDHRHNFSPYNTLLYLSSSAGEEIKRGSFESLAFIPQLFLSAIAIPLVLAKKDLAGTMLAQTFAFVAFNKVCTSQVSLPFPPKTNPN
jgi:phosphatidylinositol glycan class M